MKATRERRAARRAREEAEEAEEANTAEEEQPEDVPVNDREGLSGHTVNPLRSRFDKEKKKALEARRARSRVPFAHRVLNSKVAWHHFVDICGTEGAPGIPLAIAMPERPQWDEAMDKDALDDSEQDYFNSWQRAVRRKYKTDDLSYYERNLEVWRQLWRVVEACDVVLVVGDARYPTLHMPASLYHYVVHKHRKPLMYVLNKIDLIDATTLAHWKAFYAAAFPGVTVMEFTSHPCEGTVTGDHAGWKRRKERNPVRYDVYQRSDDQQPSAAALSPEQKTVMGYIDAILAKAQSLNAAGPPQSSKAVTRIGLVGHPNVGKSSLLNCLKGAKVVSVSGTPGHTKHLQTINLGDDVVLYDCPGLVFPYAHLPRGLQVVCGLYPVAQCSSPYESVQWLCERLPLEKLLHLEKPDYYDAEDDWSSWMVSEAYAAKRGFHIHRGRGRLDAHRAALALLQDAQQGRIVVYTLPPEDHVDAAALKLQQVDEVSLENLECDDPLSEGHSDLSDPSAAVDEEPDSDEDVSSGDQEHIDGSASGTSGSAENEQKTEEVTKTEGPKGKAGRTVAFSEPMPTPSAKPERPQGRKVKGKRYTRRQAALDADSDSGDNSLANNLREILDRDVLSESNEGRKETKGGRQKAPKAARELPCPVPVPDVPHGDRAVDEDNLSEERVLLFREHHRVVAATVGSDVDASSSYTPVLSCAKLVGQTMSQGVPLTEEVVSACLATARGCDVDQGLDTAEATPIQSEAWGLLLRADPPDAVLVSPTGSGKTLAYLLPVFAALAPEDYCTDSPQVHPRALVIAPTRELGMQIAAVADTIVNRVSGRMVRGEWGTQWSVLCAVGGSPLGAQQAKLLSVRPDVLVATPGRLLALCGHGDDEAAEGETCTAVCSLASLQMWVLDECDRLLDLGFTPSVNAIAGLIRPPDDPHEPHTVLASATWPAALHPLAERLLRPGAVRLTVGGQDLSVARSVTQVLEAVPSNPAARRKRLCELVDGYLAEDKEDAKPPQVLVFVTYKREARDIADVLQKRKIGAVALQGDMTQNARASVLERFRTGEAQVLVATDVASRGLDVPGLEYVINYSPGLSLAQYVHRVGRCGRAGSLGRAHTFIVEADRRMLPGIVRFVQESGQPIPNAIQHMLRHVEEAAEDDAIDNQEMTEEQAIREEQQQANRERQLEARKRQQQKAHQQQKQKGGRRGKGKPG